MASVWPVTVTLLLALIEMLFATPSALSEGFFPVMLIDTSSPVFAAARTALQTAFDHEVLEMGSGGSIPLVPVLVETFPGIEVLIWGAADHLSNYHSRNESVDLGEVVRMAQAEALFLRSLGEGA